MKDKLATIGAIIWIIGGIYAIVWTTYRVWDTYDQRQRAIALLHSVEAHDVANNRAFKLEVYRIHRFNDRIARALGDGK